MDDLTITRLCAEAMGWPKGAVCHPDSLILDGDTKKYNPLHDDAQAMALVKKLRLSIDVFGKWMVQDKKGNYAPALSHDLNRAICECVAKMQQSKGST